MLREDMWKSEQGSILKPVEEPGVAWHFLHFGSMIRFIILMQYIQPKCTGMLLIDYSKKVNSFRQFRRVDYER